MDSFLVLNVKGILRESIKIFGKNGRLMSYVTISTLVITSLLYVFNLFSIKPLITDLLIDQKDLPGVDPNSAQFSNLVQRIIHDLRLLLGIELVYLVVDTIIFTLLAAITILASAIIHSGKELYFKDLVSTSLKPWMRVLVTQLCNGVFNVAFVILFAFILAPVLVMLQHPHAQIAAAVLLGVLAFGMYLYVIVIWQLSLIVSAMEEIRGPSAFKKASQLIKGLKKEGFMLNLFFIIISSILGLTMKLSPEKLATLSVTFVLELVVENCVSVVKMWRLMAFTIFYYQCKKTHGESIELQGTINGYSKIPESAPLVDQDVP